METPLCCLLPKLLEQHLCCFLGLTLQAKDAASRGLRVLCVAYREMDRVAFEEWKARFDAIEDANERANQDLDR